eukprot:gene10689-12381_t
MRGKSFKRGASNLDGVSLFEPTPDEQKHVDLVRAFEGVSSGGGLTNGSKRSNRNSFASYSTQGSFHDSPVSSGCPTPERGQNSHGPTSVDGLNDAVDLVVQHVMSSFQNLDGVNMDFQSQVQPKLWCSGQAEVQSASVGHVEDLRHRLQGMYTSNPLSLGRHPSPQLAASNLRSAISMAERLNIEQQRNTVPYQQQKQEHEVLQTVCSVTSMAEGSNIQQQQQQRNPVPYVGSPAQQLDLREASLIHLMQQQQEQEHEVQTTLNLAMQLQQQEQQELVSWQTTPNPTSNDDGTVGQSVALNDPKEDFLQFLDDVF